MTSDLQEITQQALRLPPDDRVTLAETLLLTIDEAHDLRVDESIMKELERRLAEVRTGTAVGIPAAQVFHEIRARLQRDS